MKIVDKIHNPTAFSWPDEALSPPLGGGWVGLSLGGGRVGLFLFLLFFLPAPIVASDGKHTVSGRVRTPDGAGLPDASVYTPEGRGAATDKDGFYSLLLPAGMVTLIISHVSYEPCTLTFRLRADTTVHVELSGAIRLSDVQVMARRSNRRINTVRLSMQRTKTLPGFMGGGDPIQAVRLLPGIQSAADVGGGLYVRGGSAGENLVLLDGMPLYKTSHLLDMFSLFDAGAIERMDVMKGGFPARYGGRVSSVIDITLKSGDMEHFHGEGEIGLVSAKATVGGPLWKDRLSLIVSARRTYVDLLMGLLSDYASGDRQVSLGYWFYDATAKLTYRMTDKDRLSLSLYTGEDMFRLRDTSSAGEEPEGRKGRMTWGHLMPVFRWQHTFSSRAYAGIFAAFVRYRSLAETSIWETRQAPPPQQAIYTYSYGGEYLSGIADQRVGAAFGLIPSERYDIRAGVSAVSHTFHPGELTYTQQGIRFEYNNGAVRSREYGAYIENRYRPFERLRTEFGLHWSGYAVDGTFHREWQPRISVAYLPAQNLSLKASYARMAQYTHLLVNSNVGMPVDLWVPSTATLRPQVAGQLSAGMVWNTGDRYGAGFEAWYKRMDGVVEYREGASYIDPRTYWEDKVFQGEGRSCGVELFVFRRTGTWTGWAGYTLSRSDRRFDKINGGRRFPYKYDRLHDVSVVVTKKIGKRMEASALWVFASGSSLTLPVATYRLTNPLDGSRAQEYYAYTGRNAYRMPPYHRLDVSLTFSGKNKRRFSHQWVIGAYNVYSRRNPFYIDIEGAALIPGYDDSNNSNTRDEALRYVQYSLFPVIPYVSWRISPTRPPQRGGGE